MRIRIAILALGTFAIGTDGTDRWEEIPAIVHTYEPVETLPRSRK